MSKISLFVLFLLAQILAHGIDEDILQSAQKENKAIILAFLGTQCPWSQKMKKEILENPLFLDRVKKGAILSIVALDSQANENEEKIRKRFSVHNCPVLILLDPQAREFARFEFLIGDSKEFAEQILQTIEDFKSVCHALEEPKKQKNWIALYEKAKQFSSIAFKNKVLETGLKEAACRELLLEKYLNLLESKKIKDKAVQRCRNLIIALDPNDVKSYFEIAMADFQKLKKMKAAKKNSKKIVRPLVNYLLRFEEKDRENAWKAHMALAEYLIGIEKADGIFFAKKAYESSPKEVKEEIAQWIAGKEK